MGNGIEWKCANLSQVAMMFYFPKQRRSFNDQTMKGMKDYILLKEPNNPCKTWECLTWIDLVLMNLTQVIVDTSWL